MASYSFQQLVTTIRIRGTFILSLLMLAFSVFYCLTSVYALSTGYAGSYIITASFFGIYDFVLKAISFLQITGLFIWIVICLTLIISNRKYWWVVFVLQALTTIIFILGTLVGGFGYQFKNIHSITHQSHSYYLNHIYDADDGFGKYSLLRCDILNINCQKIYESQDIYPQIDTNAQVVVDKTANELRVIVAGKAIYMHNLLP